MGLSSALLVYVLLSVHLVDLLVEARWRRYSIDAKVWGKFNLHCGSKLHWKQRIVEKRRRDVSQELRLRNSQGGADIGADELRVMSR